MNMFKRLDRHNASGVPAGKVYSIMREPNTAYFFGSRGKGRCHSLFGTIRYTHSFLNSPGRKGVSSSMELLSI